jgi:hypothetical protein
MTPKEIVVGSLFIILCALMLLVYLLGTYVLAVDYYKNTPKPYESPVVLGNHHRGYSSISRYGYVFKVSGESDAIPKDATINNEKFWPTLNSSNCRRIGWNSTNDIESMNISEEEKKVG